MFFEMYKLKFHAFVCLEIKLKLGREVLKFLTLYSNAITKLLAKSVMSREFFNQ